LIVKRKISTQYVKQGAFWGALLFACTYASAKDCKFTAASFSGGLIDSRWQEFSATGQFLLEEKGTLIAERLNLEAFCFGTEWHVDWSQARGQRHYAGLTNKQQAATTTTDIQDESVNVGFMLPLNNFWSAGIGLERRDTYRNIRSTDKASGYPERFKELTGLAGLRYKVLISENTNLAASIWVGESIDGRVWLGLPNADPTTLTLGKGSIQEATLTWSRKTSSQSKWFWAYTVHWRSTDKDAGPATALKRNDRLIGSAIQPRTTTQSFGFNARIGYLF
jgi:hypothetical protein